MGKYWQFKNSGKEDEVELRIDGEIISDDDAWLYEWFEIPYTAPNTFREELKSYAGKQITVWIDSWGGDVLAGVGMYNALKEHKGKVTVKVDGKAVSAASIITMAGEEILMSPGSIMMIHNPWMRTVGESKDMRHSADVLDEVKEAIINVYRTKTKRSYAKISEMMDNETWMSAKTAIAEGFADGMLYAEKEQQEPAALNFSRLAVQNSCTNAMKHFLEMYKEKVAAKTPEEPRRQVPADLYTKLENIIERRARL